MNLQERLTAFAMLGATWVMWVLVVLSIIGLAIVLERAYYMLSSRDDVTRLREDLRELLLRNDLEAAKRRMSTSPSFEARIALAGLEAAERGEGATEEQMAGASKLAKLSMERNLAFLGTVGNNAPFVGLLGTVIGIIRSFQALNASQGQVTSGLMAEVGEALVATAIGILVALPSVAFFNFFQRVIRGRLGRADALGHELMAYLKGEKATRAQSSGGAH